MPKRKRDEPVSRSKDVPSMSRAERLLDDGQRSVANALKLCQRFERQKLGRRVKDATAENGDSSAKSLDRLNREIKALKTIDFDAVARQHVHRVLLRIKTISSSDLLPDGFKSQTFPALDDDTRTLLARLYKAKAVKAATDAIVASFRQLIAESSPSKLPSDEDAPPDADQKAIQESHPPNDDESNGSEHREASVSPTPSPEPSNAFSSDDDDVGEDAPRPVRGRTSAFLPSLSAVGYLSDPDSDASSVASDVAPRRNRRGQRARRAIAEKKHGARAKHLLQQQQRQQSAAGGGGGGSRSSGWDARRGAVAVADGAARDPKQPLVNAERAKMMAGQRFVKPERGETTRPAKPPMQRQEVPPAKTARNRDDKGPIHASWAAKKQQKAAEKNATRKFEGQRIVFD